MDARRYNPLSAVAPGQFTTDQRQRLEAFTAAVGLLGKDREISDLLHAASFITDGRPIA